MFIDTRAFDFPLTKPIQDRVEARVAAAIGGATDSLRSVTVRLHDVNGTRGGIDKRCRIVVTMHGRGLMVADAIHADLYVAIDDAARRLRRLLTRASKQHLARERRQPHHAGLLAPL